MNTITADFAPAAASTAVDFEAALQPTPKGVKPDAKYGLNGKYFEPAYYVVGAGDSLPKIAKWATDHFGRTITAEQLAAQNGIAKIAEGAFLIHPEQSVRFKIFDF